eukprot:scaffold123703_cov31-Tisochrysis_lutea.AAC.3
MPSRVRPIPFSLRTQLATTRPSAPPPLGLLCPPYTNLPWRGHAWRETAGLCRRGECSPGVRCQATQSPADECRRTS